MAPNIVWSPSCYVAVVPCDNGTVKGTRQYGHGICELCATSRCSDVYVCPVCLDCEHRSRRYTVIAWSATEDWQREMRRVSMNIAARKVESNVLGDLKSIQISCRQGQHCRLLCTSSSIWPRHEHYWKTMRDIKIEHTKFMETYDVLVRPHVRKSSNCCTVFGWQFEDDSTASKTRISSTQRPWQKTGHVRRETTCTWLSLRSWTHSCFDQRISYVIVQFQIDINGRGMISVWVRN